MRGGRCQNRLRTNSETVLKNFYRVPKVAILKVVSVVEMTSYHILLNGNFDQFDQFGQNLSEQFIQLGPQLNFQVYAAGAPR